MTVIAAYLQSETVADLLYAMCFCNVYAWILIKYKLHFAGFRAALRDGTNLPNLIIESGKCHNSLNFCTRLQLFGSADNVFVCPFHRC